MNARCRIPVTATAALCIALLSAGVRGQTASVPTSEQPAAAEGGNSDEADPWDVDFELHGIFDNRFMLYSSNINFTTSNTQRSIATTTTSGGRADLYVIPGPNGERDTGWQLEGAQPNLPRLDGVKDTFAEIRYRPRLELATQNGAIRGIWEIEIGGIRFGAAGHGRGQGGSFSTDGANVETRLAYTELNLEPENQLQIGLIPLETNRHLWQEATAGIQASGPLWVDGNYHVAWARGLEDRRAQDAFPEDPIPPGFQDMDAFFLRYDHDIGGSRVGVFGMYQRGAVERDKVVRPTEVFAEGYSLWQFPEVDFDLTSVGTDASFKFGAVFLNLDFLYQFGKFRDLKFYAADNFFQPATSFEVEPSAVAQNSCDPAQTAPPCFTEIDQTGMAGRLEGGVELGKLRVQYTGYYISGDDNPRDGKWKAFLSTDVDFFDSAIFFEGVLLNDTVHSQNPYLFDKGYILNKVDVTYALTPKLTLAGAVVSNRLAEDIQWTGLTTMRDPMTNELIPTAPIRSADLGIEVQARATYRFNERLQAGALVASLVAPGTAWDFYEVSTQRNGTPEQDYTTVQANLAFTF